MWATVHADGLQHPPHDHPQSLASGTVYLATPAASGRLVLLGARVPPLLFCLSSSHFLRRTPSTVKSTDADLGKSTDADLARASAAPRRAADPRRDVPSAWSTDDTLEDAGRGGDADAFGTRVALRPTPGLLVLFPPWLRHSVEPTTSRADDSARVAFSFNVGGSWAQLARFA
eukprot:5965623-Prymnesium_polylepis.1